MIFVHEKTDLHLHRFLGKIGSRPQTWRVITIEFQDSETVRSALFQELCRNQIQELFKDTDANIFWQKPGFILVCFQGRVQPIENCVKKLLKEIEFKGVKRFFDILDLSIDWQSLLKLMDQVTLPQAKSASPIGQGLSVTANSTKKNDFNVSLSRDIIKQLKPYRQARPRPVLMIVEDNPVVLMIAKAVVERHFDVVMAETVRQALVYYQRHLPDMVFMDIQLPDGNGIDLLEEIKDADSEAHIVMLSGETQKEKIQASLDNGAHSFIQKPFTEQDLLDAANEYLYQKDIRDESSGKT